MPLWLFLQCFKQYNGYCWWQRWCPGQFLCVCCVCVKRLCVYLLAWCAPSTLFACSWMRLDVRGWLYRQKAKRQTAKQLTSMKILGVRTLVALLPQVMFHTWGPAADSLKWRFCLSLQNMCVIISVRLLANGGHLQVAPVVGSSPIMCKLYTNVRYIDWIMPVMLFWTLACSEADNGHDDWCIPQAL